MDQNWVIELDREDYRARNHLLLIANGYVGVRASFGELFQRADCSTHVMGIYDQVGYDDPDRDPWHPERDPWKEIINVPNFMLAGLRYDGETVWLTDENVSDFHARLDLRRATVSLDYTWTSSQGRRLQVRQRRWCAYHRRNLVVSELTCTALDADGELICETAIDGNVADAHGPHLERFAVGEQDGGIWLQAFTQQHGYELGICSRHEVSGPAQAVVSPAERAVRQTWTLSLKQGRAASVTSQHAVFSSRDSHDPLAEARAQVVAVTAERQAHEAALAEHWQACDVVIEGDEKAQRYMRYNLYILMVSIPKDFDYASIPSRSLSAATYKGAIFWEVDTYAFTFYAYVFPEYARNLLLYRYKCLMYALKKARDLGYRGAYFAWESLDTGEEATKKLVWQDIHSGRMMRNYFGDRQYHIAGDVIYAVWQYVEATGDWDFILDYGAEMTLQVARFVGDLVYYKKPKDRYEILHTVCPDEYHEEVDNNTFTNRVCRFVLERVFDLLDQLDQRAPTQLERLLSRLRVTDEEIEYWAEVRDKLYVREPDARFVIEQHDGYFELEDITLDAFKSRIMGDEYLGHQIGPAPLTQIVKQADVIQLLVMFKDEYHPVVRKATLDYYHPRTEHGSGDSPNAYGIVAAQVGDRELGYHYFMHSARIDLESANPKQKANFFLGGVHIAPSGGTWQVVALGFAGLSWRDEVLRFDPCLPAHWSRLTFQMTVRGQALTVSMDQKILSVTSREGNALRLNLRVNDQPVVSLDPGERLERSYRLMGRHYYTY